MSKLLTDTQSHLTNDRLISDYLDALFTTPMPTPVFRSRFQLSTTIDIAAITSGRHKPTKFELVLALLTLVRLAQQLNRNRRLRKSVVEASHVLVVHLRRLESKE